MVRFKSFLCCFSPPEPELPVPAVPSPALAVSSPTSSPAPRLLLTLKVVESVALPLDTKIAITTAGMINGRRGVKDGYCYFGSQSLRSKPPGNDFIFPRNEDGLGGQHFSVKYDKHQKCFILIDSGEGSGTFLRIRDWREFGPSAVISFEETNLMVTKENAGRLKVQFIEGANAEQPYVFSPADKVIFIGRMSDCRVFIEESQSRYSACFRHDQSRGWLVADGDGRRPSKHGAWVFVDKGIPLVDGSEIKVAQTRLCATLETL